MLSTREPQIGGGPAGGAGQVHQNPNSEFGAAEHTHTMSGLEIGLMVGIVLFFATVIGSLFWYRARKLELERMQAQSDQEADEDSFDVQDPEAEAYGEVKEGKAVPTRSFRQLFGRKWLGPKGSRFFADRSVGYEAVANKVMRGRCQPGEGHSSRDGLRVLPKISSRERACMEFIVSAYWSFHVRRAAFHLRSKSTREGVIFKAWRD